MTYNQLLSLTCLLAEGEIMAATLNTPKSWLGTGIELSGKEIYLLSIDIADTVINSPGDPPDSPLSCMLANSSYMREGMKKFS